MRDTRHDILTFWFEETKPAQWFQKSDAFDSLIRERFLKTYELAREGIYDSWMSDADGCLALCIVLDQFPRNMFRDSPQAFATDGKALEVAKHAIAKGFDQMFPALKRRFLYLPFEHSEAMEHQQKSVALFEKIKKDDPLGYDYAVRHLKVIEQFGRFPHRNKVLGRENTPQEQEYLARPDSGF